MESAKHGPIAAACAQGRNRGAHLGLRHLSQHRTPEISGHAAHFVRNGSVVRRQIGVGRAGVHDAERGWRPRCRTAASGSRRRRRFEGLQAVPSRFHSFRTEIAGGYGASVFWIAQEFSDRVLFYYTFDAAACQPLRPANLPASRAEGNSSALLHVGDIGRLSTEGRRFRCADKAFPLRGRLWG